MQLRLFAVSAVFFVTSVWAAPPKHPVPALPATDYEVEFDKRFPLVAGAHQVADWELYTALVAGDIVEYATKIDPVIAESFAGIAGKGYQTERLEAQVKQDKRLRAAFVEHRRRIAAMPLFADGAGPAGGGCRQPLVYQAREFRLIFGEALSNDAPLVHSTVAPPCARAGGPALQITAGRSSRFKCWTLDQVTTCGWRLPDMPLDLKRVIESEYPSSIRTRWRWRGLGGVTRVRYPGMYGTRAEGDSVALTVPVGLALEFIDSAGRIRWTADSAGWTGTVTARDLD
jgi:hypothetical protein